ncbi:hypothetical protein ACO0SA_000974 [Hanseniaspora valbyensis]
MLKTFACKNSLSKGSSLSIKYQTPTILTIRYQSTSSPQNNETPKDLVLKSKLDSKPINGSLDFGKKVKKNDRYQPDDLKLNNDKLENSYKLTNFQESLISFMVKYFRLNVDKIRAGAISGSYYYKQCSIQGLQYEDEDGGELSASCKFFYEDLKLPKTFSQWYQIHLLHVWILFVRMRALPFDIGQNYQKKLVDRTFQELERKLKEEMNVRSGKFIDTYLKEFNSQLRGCIFAYDEGFYTDDYTLAKAIWRNLFSGRKNIDFVHLEAIVRYVRSQLYVLSKMSDRDFAMGNFSFIPSDEFVKPLTEKEYEELKQQVIAKYENIDNDPDTRPIDKSKLRYDNKKQKHTDKLYSIN